jgi:heme A synthase
MRWRHNTLAWQTHRVQAGREREARKTKWVTFWAAVISSAVLVLYAFVASGTALGADRSNHSPAPHPTKSASVGRPRTNR